MDVFTVMVSAPELVVPLLRHHRVLDVEIILTIEAKSPIFFEEPR